MSEYAILYPDPRRVFCSIDLILLYAVLEREILFGIIAGMLQVDVFGIHRLLLKIQKRSRC